VTGIPVIFAKKSYLAFKKQYFRNLHPCNLVRKVGIKAISLVNFLKIKSSISWFIFKTRFNGGFFSSLLSLSIGIILLSHTSFAQYTIEGHVRDMETREAIPFVNVFISGTTAGATTDTQGYYKFTTQTLGDSLIARFVGYDPQVFLLNKEKKQTVDFYLKESTVNLDEVIFEAPENPAFEILRNVVKNKDINNRDVLSSYVSENYTKIEFDVAQMDKKFQQKKLVQKVWEAIDSLEDYRNEDGRPSIPIFHSESISKMWIQNSPYLQREKILKAKIVGVGVKDKKQVSQLTGVAFQQYNFYDNWMTIIDKEFKSPIADSWKSLYEYYLTDSAMVGDDFAYKIEFEPKNKMDLAFVGYMWITRQNWALKQIEAEIVGDKANLNFIQSIYIYQELEKTAVGPWLPTQTKFEVRIDQLADNFAGVTAKFLIASSDWEFGDDKPESFYINPVDIAEDVVEDSPQFWNETRPVPLDEDDRKALEAIHTIRSIPAVNMVAEAIKTIRRGYVRVHPNFDIGPWHFIYAHNNIEKNRFRVGFRTTSNLTENWVFSGYLAYGTGDEKLKYGATIDRILSKKPFALLTFKHSHELEQLGVIDESRRKFFLFSAAARFGTLGNPHILDETSIRYQTDIIKGLTQSVQLKTLKFTPQFPFAFLDEDSDGSNYPRSVYRSSEVVFETRLARDELFIYDNNLRFVVGVPKAPIITFRYTIGLNDVLGSDVDYHKLLLRWTHRINFGSLGTGVYTLEGGYIPTEAPFPSLKNHVGNETFFSHVGAFNLMNFGEFVSDRWGSLKYDHFFQGYILNRIPLMRKLKWRLVASTNVLMGGLRDENKALIPEQDAFGNPIEPVNTIENNEPYVEVGYGVENIFKILKIMAFQRLTYIDEPDRDVDKFGVRIQITIKP